MERALIAEPDEKGAAKTNPDGIGICSSGVDETPVSNRTLRRASRRFEIQRARLDSGVRYADDTSANRRYKIVKAILVGR